MCFEMKDVYFGIRALRKDTLGFGEMKISQENFFSAPFHTDPGFYSSNVSFDL